MTKPHKPMVDQWYEDVDGQAFQVVAVDVDDETVAVQYFNGDLEELDMDAWYQLLPQPMAAPEDWSGPFDDLEPDDFGDTEAPYHPEDWNGPADEMERED